MIFNQTYVSPPYAPLIWNDTGKYNYFYIDFKKTLAPFSMGMFVESILVFGTAPITVTGVEKVNTTTYKIYANISGLIHGFVVMSKSPTRLKLITGKELPAFSTFAFVAGISSYIDGGYLYEITTAALNSSLAEDIFNIAQYLSIECANISESITQPTHSISSVDTVTIILI